VTEAAVKDIRETFGLIRNQALWVHAKWRLYKQLFRGAPKDQQLFSGIALDAFIILREALLADIFTTLTRLSDPPELAGHENLVLALLLPLFAGDVVAQDDYRERIGKFDGAVADLRKHRNKRLAHNDLTTMRALSADLPKIEEGDIENALRALRDALALPHEIYGSPLDYLNFELRGSGDDLLNALRKAALYDREGRGAAD
jgi:hypothetical protein